MDKNNLFIGLAIFYSILVGFLGLYTPTGLTAEYNELQTSLNDILGDTEDIPVVGGFLVAILDFIFSIVLFSANIFYNISGFPNIINLLLFTPLGLIASYFLIEYIKSFVHGG